MKLYSCRLTRSLESCQLLVLEATRADVRTRLRREMRQVERHWRVQTRKHVQTRSATKPGETHLKAEGARRAGQ